jgi:hypothetical protein
MFDGLRRILEYACSLRARDELIILPMCSAVSIEATRRRELAAVALPD